MKLMTVKPDCENLEGYPEHQVFESASDELETCHDVIDELRKVLATTEATVTSFCRTWLEGQGYTVLQEPPRAVIWCLEGGTPESVLANFPFEVRSLEPENDGLDGNEPHFDSEGTTMCVHQGVDVKVDAPAVAKLWQKIEAAESVRHCHDCDAELPAEHPICACDVCDCEVDLCQACYDAHDGLCDGCRPREVQNDD